MRKFTIPSPIKPNTNPIIIDLRDPNATLQVAFDVSEDLQALHLAIATRLITYLKPKLTPLFAKAGSNKKYLNDEPREATGVMTAVYIGRRVGTVEIKLADSEGEPRNDSGVILSQCLDRVAKLIGEKQATQIFMQLEKITNDELEKHFGRSRGK